MTYGYFIWKIGIPKILRILYQLLANILSIAHNLYKKSGYYYFEKWLLSWACNDKILSLTFFCHFEKFKAYIDSRAFLYF
jgi:hypothetical protein